MPFEQQGCSSSTCSLVPASQLKWSKDDDKHAHHFCCREGKGLHADEPETSMTHAGQRCICRVCPGRRGLLGSGKHWDSVRIGLLRTVYHRSRELKHHSCWWGEQLHLSLTIHHLAYFQEVLSLGFLTAIVMQLSLLLTTQYLHANKR